MLRRNIWQSTEGRKRHMGEGSSLGYGGLDGRLSRVWGQLAGAPGRLHFRNFSSQSLRLWWLEIGSDESTWLQVLANAMCRVTLTVVLRQPVDQQPHCRPALLTANSRETCVAGAELAREWEGRARKSGGVWQLTLRALALWARQGTYSRLLKNSFI